MRESYNVGGAPVRNESVPRSAPVKEQNLELIPENFWPTLPMP